MNIEAMFESAQRIELTNELHARPFPRIQAPCQAVCFALLADGEDASAAHQAHLNALFARLGLQPLRENAVHFYGDIGTCELKWERHTEFFTYTFLAPRRGSRPFIANEDLVPQEWVAGLPGTLVSASIVEIEALAEGADAGDVIRNELAQLLVRESMAVNFVLDEAGLIASDFRLDANGFSRFCLRVPPQTGAARIGRITQRILEIENYRAMSMLSLPVARDVWAELDDIDRRLAAATEDMTRNTGDRTSDLENLMDISASLEALNVRHDARFSAARAYSDIVRDRLQLLRETRVGGWQTFGEFLTRRYEPAMRTCVSSRKRLRDISARAAHAGDMLRTQINVATEQQNGAILASMDARSEQSLKLQETVEGLSVIAVSYYAVGLLIYLLAPIAVASGFDSKALGALLVVPVVVAVWMLVKRVRRRIGTPARRDAP